jgi:hypothetical protein
MVNNTTQGPEQFPGDGDILVRLFLEALCWTAHRAVTIIITITISITITASSERRGPCRH